MERLDSAIVTLVLEMKEIVIQMMNVKVIFFVDQTTVWLHLVLALKLIAVIKPILKIALMIILVLKMKEIVIHMMSVKMVLFVDQTIVQLHLVLTLKLIVVINQLLEMKIFVHLEFLVEKMREIVTPIVNVKATTSVDQIIVWPPSVLTLKLIAVVVLKL